MLTQSSIHIIRDLLLQWYDQQCYALPWRSYAPDKPNPYTVWLSEIMLQQTTVTTVIPYYTKFKSLWPTLVDFSQASLEELRHAWQGLGYYSRVRNMHACAKRLVDDYQGHFPNSVDELLKLPGIGHYTAAAVAAIVYDEQIVPADGNVYRVMARLFAVIKPLPKAQTELQNYAAQFTSDNRPGDFAQALMDFGRTVCKPRAPLCEICPIQKYCQGYETGNPAQFPHRTVKTPRPKYYANAHIFINDRQEIALRYRPESGLLAGLIEVPTSEWLRNQPFIGGSDTIIIRHIFTHIDLSLRIIINPTMTVPEECFWEPIKSLSHLALPRLTSKIIETVIQHYFHHKKTGKP